jgi:DNA-binding GntR family transcriptional regulator
MPARSPDGPRAGEAARAHAITALRRAILGGDVAPGQRLIEEELAATLGVTRQSLRAALLDLTAEGLVERIPNRGARVRTVTTEEAVAITECRMALEALCATKAAERISDEEAAQLRELGEHLKSAVADGNPLKYSELNRELHRRIGVISSGSRCGPAGRRYRSRSTWPYSTRSRSGGPATRTAPSAPTSPASSRHCKPAIEPKVFTRR